MLGEFFRGGFGMWITIWLLSPWGSLLIFGGRIEPVSRSLLYWAVVVWTVIVLAVWGAIVKATPGCCGDE